MLRPALEAAWVVARAGEAPRRLRPVLMHARLTNAALATVRRVLDEDSAFRALVAAAVTEESVGRASWLFLVRPEGWEDELAGLVAAAAEGSQAQRAAGDERVAARRLKGAEEALRRAEAALAAARADAARASEELRQERRVRRAAEAAAEASAAEARALRERLAGVEAEREALPAAPSPTPAAPTTAPPRSSPDDRVEAPTPKDRRKAVRPARRRPAPLPPAVRDDTPEAADHLVRVPGVLVLVDGYNASLAYRPDLPIPELRRRLVDALDELAARTGADVLVVFDGAEVVDAGPTTRTGGRRRAARVRFSEPDVEADDLILGIVDETPTSRPVVVASDDRRVQDGARGRGANVVSSGQLLAALRRER